ncbi:VOC family protein [Paenarthrobacter sp. PH39-S1]|uniref:VOC family protein n=1 Tax=Paenarthrobacter sp. PH39-S1 TaxID=3046204 RepID=UPI0024B8BD20|nr:VOC family protein [Paenarthrobacter sp. PH39-S1]MDJ0356074.1 glyoxalase [Paenarthrobacter sp. PH39-S1]
MSETQAGANPSATTPAAVPAPNVWPALQARDAVALIDYLVDCFGFLRTAVYMDGEAVAHAQLDWPEGGGIMLGSYKPAGPFTLEPGTFAAYVVCSDIPSLHRRVLDHGGLAVTEPVQTDYGSLDFSASDTEGNHWTFGTYRGEPRTPPAES